MRYPRGLRVEIKPTLKNIFEQLNRSLAEKVEQGKLIQHNLESGLIAEKAVRAVLKDFLPLKYGVAKGKVMNSTGAMSRHCDIIIYDRMNCPTLYVDENENQILPIEHVSVVVEVKMTLTKHTLTEAFGELSSVAVLQPDRPDRSVNSFVEHRPPALEILGFKGPKLQTLKSHYVRLNGEYPVTASFTSYSPESPAYPKITGNKFMVHSINCLGAGCVDYMYDGQVAVRDWGNYTLGMFLMMVHWNAEQIVPTDIPFSDYMSYILAENPNFFKPLLYNPKEDA